MSQDGGSTLSAPGQPLAAAVSQPSPSGSQEQLAARFGAIIQGVRDRGLDPQVEEVAALLPLARDPLLRGEMGRLLGFYRLRSGDHEAAVALSDAAARDLADHPELAADCVYNAIFALFKLGRLEEVAERARQALASFGETFLWHNVLSTALGHLGRLKESRWHGSRSLECKDALTAGVPGRDLSGCPLPRFDPTRPETQIISFSLFGTDPKYCQGAVRNAEAAPYLYPGWTCRFYVDAGVAKAVVEQLLNRGAQVIRMAPQWPAASHGTLWRFLVADDPGVRRWIVRDADSLLNIREATAVQEWLASDRHFHLMRDHFDHSELVLAGLWGGVHGALPPLPPVIGDFLASRPGVLNRTADQELLREVLWPTIRTSVLVHDSQFSFGERRDFSPFAALAAGNHLGCDWRRMVGITSRPGGPPPPGAA
jgi:hypothetical protein